MVLYFKNHLRSAKFANPITPLQSSEQSIGPLKFQGLAWNEILQKFNNFIFSTKSTTTNNGKINLSKSTKNRFWETSILELFPTLLTKVRFQRRAFLTHWIRVAFCPSRFSKGDQTFSCSISISSRIRVRAFESSSSCSSQSSDLFFSYFQKNYSLYVSKNQHFFNLKFYYDFNTQLLSENISNKFFTCEFSPPTPLTIGRCRNHVFPWASEIKISKIKRK